MIYLFVLEITVISRQVGKRWNCSHCARDRAESGQGIWRMCIGKVSYDTRSEKILRVLIP